MKRMIIKSIFPVALILAGLSVKAQTPETSPGVLTTTFGVKGGINLSNLYVDDVSDENTKIGFQVGFFAKAPLSDFFSIQPEIIYSLKGAQLEYDNFIAKGKASFNLHYIEVPVMAVFNIGKNFNIHAGPYVSYLAGVDVKNKTTDGDFDFEEEISRDNFEKFDYGIAGGIGADGPKVGFGLRYNYGLKEIGKEKEIFGQPYRFSNAKNAVIQAYVTLGF